jgi:glutamine cyclotransferase
MVPPKNTKNIRKRQKSNSKSQQVGTHSTSSMVEVQQHRQNNNIDDNDIVHDDDAIFDKSIRRQKPSYVLSSLSILAVFVSVILLLGLTVDDNETISTDTITSTQTKSRNLLYGNVTSSTRTKMGTYKLLETIPHDPNSFTQGLITVTDPSDGILKMYEGTGLNGQSEIRLISNISSGTVIARRNIPFRYFGEGITHFIDSNNTLRLLQITWKDQTAFEYLLQGNNATQPSWTTRLRNLLTQSRFCRRRRRRLRFVCTTTTTSTTPSIQYDNVSPLTVSPPISTWSYTTTTNEGWGITYSKTTNQFYVTDGSNYLHTWDAITRREIKKVAVTYQYDTMDTSQSLSNLNEIEYDPITDTVLSNVWYKNDIARIDIATGFVVSMYDLTTLYPTSVRTKNADTLNGIALTYDSLLSQSYPTTTQADQIWVTGKLWPYMYRIQLIDP